MKTVYGQILADAGEFDLRPVKFTNLVQLDTKTGDGRLLESAGGGVRDLPRTMYGGFTEDQHDAAVVIGRLDAMEFDPDGKTVTAYGWLLNDEHGQKAARYIASKALRHNSVRLAEIEVKVEYDDPDDWMSDYTVHFTKWNVASTTMLGVPAFADSEIELTAALYTDRTPLEVDCTQYGNEWTAEVGFTYELTASGGDKAPWPLFYEPEADVPTGQKIVVTDILENGWRHVYGHLGVWTSCHDGVLGKCLRIPTPPDNYASYNQPGALTEQGQVETGPIFFKGGHPNAPLGERDVAAAYGGVENAWADVRIVPGKHGPWLSGVVRPGITDDVVYIARASRISGHWMPDGRLKAIVSVNCEGFNVPGSGFEVHTDENGRMTELVASLMPSPCAEAEAEIEVEVEVPEGPNEDLQLKAKALALALELDLEAV